MNKLAWSLSHTLSLWRFFGETLNHIIILFPLLVLDIPATCILFTFQTRYYFIV